MYFVMPWNWVETFAKISLHFTPYFYKLSRLSLNLWLFVPQLLECCHSQQLLPCLAVSFVFRWIRIHMIEFTQKSAPILVFQKCTPSLPSNFRAFFSALKESICPYLVFLHRWLFSLRKHEPCFLCIAALFSFLELRDCFTVLLIVLSFLSSLCLSLVQWSMWQHRPWWKARVELSVPWR